MACQITPHPSKDAKPCQNPLMRKRQLLDTLPPHEGTSSRHHRIPLQILSLENVPFFNRSECVCLGMR